MSQFKKKLSTFAAVMAFLSLSTAASYAVSITDNNVLGKTSNIDVSVSGSTLYQQMNVKQAGAVAQVDFGKFNVGKNETVFYGFSANSQTIINRVLGGNESQILGKITSGCAGNASCTSYANTGKVILINPAGVMFGQGSTVDLNSFTVSTFDFKGAQNINGVASSTYEAQLNSLGSATSHKSITFDRNITASQTGVQPNGSLTLNGTTFDNFDKYDNKSVALVSDKIDYKDSLIRTDGNFNYTYNNGQSAVSRSSVKIFSTDGVTFTYDNVGYIDKAQVSDSQLGGNVDRGITFGSNTSNYTGSDKNTVESGSVEIFASSAGKANVAIKNATIKANKLVNMADGTIKITAADKAEIANSKLITANTQAYYTDNSLQTTEGQKGGYLELEADDLTLKNTYIATAGSTNAESALDGYANIYGLSNLDVEDSTIMAAGRVRLLSNDLTTKDSVFHLENKLNASSTPDLQFLAYDSADAKINIDNTIANTTGNIDIKSSVLNSNNLTGTVNITGDYVSADTTVNIGGKNATLKADSNSTSLNAGGKLTIKAGETKIDNASVSYGDIQFYDSNSQGVNNLTIANNARFSKVANNKVAADIELETNGNITLDNSKIQRTGNSYKINTTLDQNSNITDAKVDYYQNNGYDASNIKLTSTKGNITVKNNSNVNAKQNIELNANAGNVSVQSSKLNATGNKVALNAKKDITVSSSNVTAGSDVEANAGSNITISNSKVNATNNNVVATAGKNVSVTKSEIKAGKDVNLTATKGKLDIKNSSTVQAGNNANLIAYETITFGSQGASNVNIDNTSNISAGNNILVKSTNGDINAEKTTMPQLKYGNRLEFNAKGDNNFTSENSLKGVNVDFVAGGENNITAKGDIQLVNSSLKAPKNNITTTQEGGDVILNQVTIKNATTNAKDTKTTIIAKGNVTTKDVTGTANADVNASTKTFPQSVDYKGSVTDKSVADTVLDINQTKLVVNTQVNKVTPQNNDNGSITLTVKNANNKDAGVDLVAKNEVWDAQIGPGEGPEVHLNAADGKVSITNIYTDKLTLNKNNQFIAATDAPDGTPTITVKDAGGFNMDPDTDYEPGPDGFTYDKHNDRQKDVVTERIWDERGEYVLEERPTETVYAKDYVDRTTTTIRDTEHEIHFGEDGSQEFKLVYDKTFTTVEDTPGQVTRVEEFCAPPPPPSELENEEISDIVIIKIPREQVEISKTSKVSDNTVDQTSNIMSAAAKVDVSDAAQATYSNDEDEE